MNKILFITTLLFLSTSLCFSQIVDVGISISPYSMVETTSTVPLEIKDNYLWKILDYFAGQSFDVEQNVDSDTDVSTVNISSTEVKSTLIKRTTEQ